MKVCCFHLQIQHKTLAAFSSQYLEKSRYHVSCQAHWGGIWKSSRAILVLYTPFQPIANFLYQSPKVCKSSLGLSSFTHVPSWPQRNEFQNYPLTWIQISSRPTAGKHLEITTSLVGTLEQEKLVQTSYLY